MMDTESNCPFCAIARTYTPSDSNGSSPVPVDPNSELLSPNCHLILNHRDVLAFLDIMPMVHGHILVIPRQHRVKLGDLKTSEAAILGAWLPFICRAVMRALGRDNGDWNVVQNNGPTAAQVVPHVHYHIIPRGDKISNMKAKSWTMFGRGQRDDLDDEQAIPFSALIRAELQKDLDKLHDTDPESIRLLLQTPSLREENAHGTSRANL